MTSSVRQSTDSGRAALIAELTRSSRRISVGIPSDAAAAAARGGRGLTVGQVAGFHEYGAPPHLPQRSFLRSWFDVSKKRNAEIIRRLLGAALAGRVTVSQALERIGLQFASDVKLRISEGRITPDIKQETKDRKGSDVPLIDTGQLRAAITYEVSS